MSCVGCECLVLLPKELLFLTGLAGWLVKDRKPIAGVFSQGRDSKRGARLVAAAFGDVGLGRRSAWVEECACYSITP